MDLRRRLIKRKTGKYDRRRRSNDIRQGHRVVKDQEVRGKRTSSRRSEWKSRNREKTKSRPMRLPEAPRQLRGNDGLVVASRGQAAQPPASEEREAIIGIID